MYACFNTLAASAAERHSIDLLHFFGRLHVVVLHTPVVLLMVVPLLDVLVVIHRKHRSGLALAGHWLMSIGVLGAVLAAASGYVLADLDNRSGSLVETHQVLGIVTACVAVAAWVLRWLAYRAGAKVTRGLYVVALLATVGVLVPTAHRGGDITHKPGYLSEFAPDFLKPFLGEVPTYDEPEPVQDESGAAVVTVYATQIVPIFQEHCYRCHSQESDESAYRMDRYDDLINGGMLAEKGEWYGAVPDGTHAAVVPGDPDRSAVVVMMEMQPSDFSGLAMPPAGQRVPDDQIAIVRQWVADGASREQPVAE